ncbi:probable G-protein coupled receptor 139 [Hemiscyllium ocellatum]|uniref:probable G-protein coupled receptor 139 n=1 Tax=Hemiscyllium ocellatum TaxID=170820 RepID=UPI002966AC63|nr:probable G-protein coupled receptor 139 [Hemiscyllium ocellatum]
MATGKELEDWKLGAMPLLKGSKEKPVNYRLLNLKSVMANLVVILILARRRCGLSGCVIYYLVSMAGTDLLVMITIVILNRIAGIYFPSSFLSITPVCSFRSALNFAIIDSSAWITVAFTFDRFVAICSQKLKVTYCTEKIAAWVIGLVCALSCLKNIPTYFVYEPVYVVDQVPWFCGIKDIFYLSPAWGAYECTRAILTPLLPFLLILLLNALTVRHILAANRARKRLCNQNNAENQNDPEIEKRRKSIILLFAISGSFLLLYALFCTSILHVRLANLTYSASSDFSNTAFFLQQTGYMLQLLSSCINPFIYAGTQPAFDKMLCKKLLIKIRAHGTKKLGQPMSHWQSEMKRSREGMSPSGGDQVEEDVWSWEKR